MPILLPDFALVLLVGASGAGKSTFARQHFAPGEVLSSDLLRGLLAGDESDQSINRETFELLHHLVDVRLRRRLFTVVDATNVERDARAALLGYARKHHAPAAAIVLNLPLDECKARNATRPGRAIPAAAVGRQHMLLQGSLSTLPREGLTAVYVLGSAEEIDAAQIRRRPLACDLRGQRGPFDIVGDIHGCFEELSDLLGRLGYALGEDPAALDGLGGYRVSHPHGRKLVLLGDFTDRGPYPVETLKLAISAHDAGQAICVLGNHDSKLGRALAGRDVSLKHGLGATLEALKAQPPALAERVIAWLETLEPHYGLDSGRLLVAHAGILPRYALRESRRVRSFALYGDTTGKYDQFGLPVRRNWAKGYHGQALIAYGHTPVMRATWTNNTIDLDTGCAFGNLLTALRYPELEIVSVRARRVYYERPRPLFEPDWDAPEEA